MEVNGTEYVLIRKEPRYEEEYDMEWELYGFDEETGDIFPGRYYDSAPYFGGTFYYFDGTAHNSLEADTSGFSYNMVSIPEHAIPIQQSDIQPDPESIWEFENNLSGKYAIYCKDKLITDFEYDQCGSSVSGLLAVEKDGKWGYINEEGHIVIPIEYDSSWKLRYEMGDLEYENDEENEFCYAVSNGYVPLVKNGEWELRHTDGTLAIPAGVFETIRPVQETSYEKSRLN